MAFLSFKTFRSTVQPWSPRGWWMAIQLLVDNTSGAPVGIKSPNASGPDAIFVPIDLTQAQINAPTAAMIADINSTYRLNTPPYTRYQSDGATLQQLGSNATPEIVIPTGVNLIYYSPLTITPPESLVVYGQVRVQSYPA